MPVCLPESHEIGNGNREGWSRGGCLSVCLSPVKRPTGQKEIGNGNREGGSKVKKKKKKEGSGCRL